MAITQQQLDDWKGQRAALLSDLEEFESGKVRLNENRGHGWVDVTQAAIDRTKSALATYEAMIAAAESGA
jgi:hypothetical protein